MTAVEWLENEMQKTYAFNQNDFDMFKQAKELEEQQCQDYARFAIKCDRKDLPILDFNGYNNLNK